MKNQKLSLDDFFEDELSIGLVRVAIDIPEHELFFAINKKNGLSFKRQDDLFLKKEFFQYQHSRYQAYLRENETCFDFISNKSIQSIKLKEINELFVEEENINFLLPNLKDVDYILKSSDSYADFSVILLPEDLLFQIQEFKLNSQEELYQIIQYYE